MVYVTCCRASRRATSIDLEMCNSCASLSRSHILNKRNSFSGIDPKLVLRQDSESAASAAERFSFGTQDQPSPCFVGFSLVPGGGLEPPRRVSSCGFRVAGACNHSAPTLRELSLR